MIAFIKQQPKWGFVCGRISLLEGRLSTQDFFLSLIAQDRVDDLVPQLQDTYLGEYLDPASPWKDFSALADRCFHDRVMSLRENCPSTVPADLFLLQGDYLNVRNALLGAGAYPFSPGLVTLDSVGAVAGGGAADLPGPLGAAVSRLLGDTGEVDPAAVDAVLDGAYLRHVLELCGELGAPLVSAWAQDYVLGRAVVVLWRTLRQHRPLKLYQQSLLPLGELSSVCTELIGTADPSAWPGIVGGEIGDYLAESVNAPEDEQAARFELLVANHLTRLAKAGRMQTAGPERVFSFIGGLCVEMQNLRLVVCGLLSRIAPDVLRNRLRECYA